MIPLQYYELALIIHQERIQEAQRRRPEWAYATPASPQPKSSWQLRLRLARFLHQLAARVEPSAPLSAGGFQSGQ